MRTVWIMHAVRVGGVYFETGQDAVVSDNVARNLVAQGFAMAPYGVALPTRHAVKHGPSELRSA